MLDTAHHKTLLRWEAVWAARASSRFWCRTFQFCQASRLDSLTSVVTNTVAGKGVSAKVWNSFWGQIFTPRCQRSSPPCLTARFDLVESSLRSPLCSSGWASIAICATLGAGRSSSFKALWGRRLLDKLSQHAALASAADLNGFFVLFQGGKGVLLFGWSLSELSRCCLL